MKTLKTFFSLGLLMLALALVQSSCKKDEKTPSLAIDLTFEGTYTLDGDPQQQSISFDLNADKTLTVSTSGGNGAGTYTIVNQVFNAEIEYINQPGTKYLYTAMYTPNDPATQNYDSLKNGTWGVKPSASNNGTWEMIEYVP